MAEISDKRIERMSIEIGEEDLRSVFELCDQQKNGYIFVDDFIELAKKHFCDDNEQVWLTY